MAAAVNPTTRQASATVSAAPVKPTPPPLPQPIKLITTLSENGLLPVGMQTAAPPIVPDQLLTDTALDNFVQDYIFPPFDATMAQVKLTTQKMSQIFATEKYVAGLIYRTLDESGKGYIYYIPLKFKEPQFGKAPNPFYAIKGNQSGYSLGMVKMGDGRFPETWECNFTTVIAENFAESDVADYINWLGGGANLIFEPAIGTNSARRRTNTESDLRGSFSKEISKIERHSPPPPPPSQPNVKTDEPPPAKPNEKKGDLPPKHPTHTKKPSVIPVTDPFDKFMYENFITPYTSKLPKVSGEKLSKLIARRDGVERQVVTQCLAEDGMRKAFVIPLASKHTGGFGPDMRAFITIEDLGGGIYDPKIVYYNDKTKMPTYPTPVEKIDTQKPFDTDPTFTTLLKIFRDENLHYRPDLSKKVRQSSRMASTTALATIG